MKGPRKNIMRGTPAVGGYEERVYRRLAKPAELDCYEVMIKETDLLCCTEGDLSAVIRDRAMLYRNQLEEYILARPLFGKSLVPVDGDPLAPPIAREMINASGILGVGPMAAVAGAIAEFIGRDIMTMTKQFVIENGGDIYLKTDAERIVEIYTRSLPFSGRIGIKVKPSPEACGICTSSGTVGHSLSLGSADAVCVVGESALFADGLATYLGNIVKSKDDIAAAIAKGQEFNGVKAVLIILGKNLGAWGDLDIVEL